MTKKWVTNYKKLAVCHLIHNITITVSLLSNDNTTLFKPFPSPRPLVYLVTQPLPTLVIVFKTNLSTMAAVYTQNSYSEPMLAEGGSSTSIDITDSTVTASSYAR